MGFKNRLKAKMSEGFMLQELFSQEHYNSIQAVIWHIVSAIQGEDIKNVVTNISFHKFFKSFMQNKFGVDENGLIDFDPENYPELDPHTGQLVDVILEFLLEAQREDLISPYVDITREKVEKEFYKSQDIPVFNKLFML